MPTFDAGLVNSGAAKLLQTDGWQNIMSGIGIKGVDRRESTQFSFYLDDLLDWDTISGIYRGEGFGKKIVDIPVNDMMRSGWTVEGDTDNAVAKYLNNRGLDREYRKALKWSRAFGGSLMLLGVDDGPKPVSLKVLETPLNEDNIQDVNFFRTFDRRQVIWYAQDIETDPTQEGYGFPKYYSVFPLTSGATHYPQFRVHRSRVLPFVGTALPERERQQQLGWGDSVLQSVFTRLRGFAGALSATEDILDEFIIGVMEISNLQELISGGRERDLINRLNQVDMSKHIMNTMLVDKEEKYTRLSATVNGIKDILEFFKDALSGVSGIPQVKLFGEQSQGLGSEAAGNIRLYYDDISDMQQEYALPGLQRIVGLTLKSKKFLASHKKLNQHRLRASGMR